MSLPNVRFAVKTTSVTPPSITGRYQCTTQADRDVGYREWFKTVPAIYHEINMNNNKCNIHTYIHSLSCQSLRDHVHGNCSMSLCSLLMQYIQYIYHDDTVCISSLLYYGPVFVI